MVNRTVHLGALDPLALVIKVKPSDVIPSLDVVTAATVDVEKPDGTIVTGWAATLANQGPDSLDIVHLFQAGDINQLGAYVALANMTTPEGVVPTEPIRFVAVSKFEVVQSDCK